MAICEPDVLFPSLCLRLPLFVFLQVIGKCTHTDVSSSSPFEKQLLSSCYPMGEMGKPIVMSLIT